MSHLALFLTSLAGFALLFIAMARHQQDWLRRKLPERQSRCLRAGGFAVLATGFVIAGFGFGWAHGTVVSVGWLSVGAAMVLAINTNRDRMRARLRK